MAAVLITRREATAEASLARRRDLRKLGTAMAAMIRITATTRSNSIRENPLWLRMNTPQAGASVGGRGPRGVRPIQNPSSEDESSHEGILFQSTWTAKAILLRHLRGTGSREEASAWRVGSVCPGAQLADGSTLRASISKKRLAIPLRTCFVLLRFS